MVLRQLHNTMYRRYCQLNSSEKVKKYNIGLDIGTTTVGWAVVEENTQKVIKKGEARKALWGVSLFEEAKTAEKTRSFRGTRRRYDRRRERINLLQSEFLEEINKVDQNFFQKLKESKYQEDDTVNKSIILSAAEKKKAKEYNNKYKTIFHLRSRLIHDSSKEDIRLVYLAIHHMIKYRGNFLYNVENLNTNKLDLTDRLKSAFDSLMDLASNLNIMENYEKVVSIEEITKAIMNPSKNDIKVKVKELLVNLSDNKNFGSEFGKLVVGNKFSLKKLFMLEELEKDISISFDGTDFEDKYDELENTLGDAIEVISVLKELYDTIFLKKLFKGKATSSLSDLMVERYNVHKEDLQFLKQLFDKDRKLYNQLFRTKEKACIYEQYIHNQLTYEDFIKGLKRLLENISDISINDDLRDKYTREIQPRMDNGEFLPRITDLENGKYPYQLNKDELEKIIENQGKYYPFLKDKINDEYKIVKLLKFRIPYYVGPLVSSDKSRFAWMERKIDKVKITPYNFDEVIDKETTAEKFIKRMVSHCTYLLNEFALPNHSILYSKYKVMNELKQIRINGTKLSDLNTKLPNKIMEELFMKTNGSITDKKFKEYLYYSNELTMYENDLIITGYSADGKFANNMQSYVDFFGKKGIFENTSYNENDADEIIEWITIFEDRDILEKKVRKNYSLLSDTQVKKILSRKYSGWGSLSKKLLTELTIKDKKSNISKNIMTLMEETDENFMQIINNDEYDFQKLIKENNVLKDTNKINYDLVKDLATSPATKKGIYQALKVIEEIIDYIGYEPENIMIEMARGEDKKKARKDDKKKYLQKLYQTMKEENRIDDFDNYDAMSKKLNKVDNIDSEKLFLYFIQEGKCLYSGEPLNIEDLNSAEYEVDHILPRTLIKDDSIDNKALVYRKYNQKKAASFVLPSEYRTGYMKKWWSHLKKNGLISAKKFDRLIRDSYKDEDIQGFINRQLVETRQITKHVANIISNFYKKTNVIYLKANLSHNYRERYELFKFREINDYHHAHDAYLAAVLGEYKEKFMKKDINFVMVKEMNDRLRSLGNYKQLRYGFVINSLDEQVSDIVTEISKSMINKDTGEVLFDAKRFNKQVEKTLYRNDILVSRKTEIRTGKLYKETIYPKGIGTIPVKENMPTNLYGGYSNVETSYLVLVRYGKKKKLIGIPLEIALKSKKDINKKYSFIKEQLNDIDDIEVIKDFIPYETLINYKGQKVHIKGYSISHKNCEVSNALQLKLPSNKAKEWKYVLNKVLNKKNIPIVNDIPIVSDELLNETMKKIILYLYEQKKNYPLFESEITKIEEKINFNEMNIDELEKIIVQLFTIYHCNSVNGNLKDFGLGDRIGRLFSKTIDSGIIISTSITGIKESKYEF